MGFFVTTGDPRVSAERAIHPLAHARGARGSRALFLARGRLARGRDPPRARRRSPTHVGTRGRGRSGGALDGVGERPPISGDWRRGARGSRVEMRGFLASTFSNSLWKLLQKRPKHKRNHNMRRPGPVHRGLHLTFHAPARLQRSKRDPFAVPDHAGFVRPFAGTHAFETDRTGC